MKKVGVHSGYIAVNGELADDELERLCNVIQLLARWDEELPNDNPLSKHAIEDDEEMPMPKLATLGMGGERPEPGKCRKAPSRPVPKPQGPQRGGFAPLGCGSQSGGPAGPLKSHGKGEPQS